MRRRALISVYSKNIEELKSIFEMIKQDLYDGKIYDGYFTVKIYEDTKGYIILMNEVEARKLKYSFAEAREYTKQELENAEFYY